MKKSNSFTFDLLKSLTSSEKAYVKKHIKTGGKHLVQLFDDLNKCNTYYREEFLKKNGKKEYANNLSQNKNYLRKKIIESLITYRSKSVLDIQIHNQINEALILIEKKFYIKAKKIIDLCLNQTLAIEDYATSYILVGIILKNLNSKIYFGLSNNEVNDYINKMNLYLTQLNIINDFAQLSSLYYSISNENERLNFSIKKLTELKLIDKSDLQENYPLPAKRIFYSAKSQIAKLSGNNDKYIFFSKKNISLYTSRKEYMKYHFTSFLRDALNFLNSLIQINDFKTFFQEHEIITNLIETHAHTSYCIDNSLTYVIRYYFLQTAYNNSKYFDKSIEFASTYLVFLKEKKHNLSEYFKATSSIEIALAHLYNHKYNLALEYLATAFNSKNYYSQYCARLIQILAHYSLKNDLLLDHLFTSFYNYLKSANKKEQIPNIRKLKKHIKNNTVHLLKNQGFEDFVYIHWDLFEPTKK